MHYFSGKGCSESLESMHYCIGILNESFKDKLLKRINIPIFTFNTVMNTDVLVELITDYFSEPKGILE